MHIYTFKTVPLDVRIKENYEHKKYLCVLDWNSHFKMKQFFQSPISKHVPLINLIANQGTKCSKRSLIFILSKVYT